VKAPFEMLFINRITEVADAPIVQAAATARGWTVGDVRYWPILLKKSQV
jgi:hypothetical protein